MSAKTAENPAVSPELQAKLDDLRGKIDKLEEGKLTGYYDIGYTVRGIMLDNSCGKPSLKSIAEHFSVGRDVLRPAAVIAKRFDRTEFDDLIKMTGPQGNRLTWTHVVSLSRIKDDAKVITLAQKSLDNGWDYRKLNKFIQKEGGGPKSKGGRKAKGVDNPEDVMDELKEATRTFCNKLDVLFGDDAALMAMFERTKADGKMPSDFATILSLTEAQLNMARTKLTTLEAVFDKIRVLTRKPQRPPINTKVEDEDE